MPIAISALVGYLLGCINPAAILARLKRKNLKELGTKNLGATNVSLIIGKKWGVFVMLLDIAKAFFASVFAKKLFPTFALAGLIAGVCAVVGHIFPFWGGFHGGKGLAAYGGMVLGYSPKIFIFLLILTVLLMIIVNYSFVMPYAASLLFCLMATLSAKNPFVFLLTALAGGLIMWKHFENVQKAKRKEDIQIRAYIYNLFHKEKKSDNTENFTS